MAPIRLRMQTFRPNQPWWPHDETLGSNLVDLVERNLERGAPTVAVVARREEVVLVPLRPFVDAKRNLALVTAGLARWDDGDGLPEAVGIIGRVRWRTTSNAPWAPLAMVFLEWPDGRWWHWQQLLNADGQALPETQTTGRAIDGLARPKGLGGWWTLARTRKPDLNLRRHVPEIRSELVQ